MTWTVVKFLEENSVEAVPSSWVKNNVCYWPPYKSQAKIRDSIIRREAFSANWSKVRIEVFQRAVYDDYSTARAKCRKAEYTSDLNSDMEMEKMSNQKRPHVSSSSDDVDDIVPSDRIFTPPSIFKGPVVKKRPLNHLPDSLLEDDEVFTDASPSSSKNTGSTCAVTSNKCADCITLRNEVKQIKGDCLTLRSEVKQMKEALSAVLTKTSIIQATQINSIDALEKISQKMDKIVDSGEISIGNDGLRNSIFVLNPYLPSRTDDEINLLEEFLSAEENMENAVKEMSLVGGDSLYEATKRIFSKCMVNSQAAKFNFTGKGNKRSIQGLRLFLLVKRAIKSNPQFGNPTDRDLEKATSAWLKRAAERKD